MPDSRKATRTLSTLFGLLERLEELGILPHVQRMIVCGTRESQRIIAPLAM